MSYCAHREKQEEKLSDDAENNTVIAVADSKYVSEISPTLKCRVICVTRTARLNQQICKQGSK